MGRDAARYERHGTLADFVALGARALRPTGSLYFVLRAERFQEFVRLSGEQGFGCITVRPIQSRAGAAVRMVLVRACRGEAGQPVAEQPVLLVHAGQGRDFTPEVAALLRA